MMASFDAMLKRVKRLEQVAMGGGQVDASIEAKTHAWVEESLYRKMAAFHAYHEGILTDEQRDEQYRRIEVEIDARKTPVERVAERRYWQRMGAEGAQEELVHRLESFLST